MVGLQSSRVGSKPFMICYFLLDATFRLIHSRQILIATEKLTLLPRLSLPFQQMIQGVVLLGIETCNFCC